MPTASRLARLQRFVVAVLFIAAAAWFAAHWPAAPWKAALGALAILFVHVPVLALEFFLLMPPVSRHDPSPRPTLRQLLVAWLHESVQAVRVFGWRQPFRWRDAPDRLDAVAPGRRGVVFIHGFMCNRGLWRPWLRDARLQGHAFAAVNLEPVFGSIDHYADIVDEAVRRVTAASGAAPVLVCHSMGGLAARAWLRRFADARQRVHHVVTIGTPHGGTWLARFAHHENTRQMRHRGAWLHGLSEHEKAWPAVPMTCWYSNCDNIVFPARTATVEGADNRFLPGVAHVDLAFRAEVMQQVFGLLSAPVR
jgi:triacylglycerol esterase/lipase EstA (alpha/beta hydrolase family)